MKKISQEITVDIVNEDGEVLREQKTTTSYVDNEPDYVKMYFKDILKMKDIQKAGNEVLFSILKRIDYSNEIFLFAPVKRKIAEELNLKEVTVSKAIEELCKKEIIIRKERGVYVVNPFYFGRGKWENIKKIRMEIGYDISGRNLTKIEFENE
jgi:predicted transcriptional regulator